MNSTNNTLTADILIEEAYQVYVYTLIDFSATALVFYTTLTAFPREIEYIWLKPFSLPTLLYIFTRYGNLINQGLSILLSFIPPGPGLRYCNILTDAEDTISFLTYIGVQGLLVIRAYSMCQGNKILISALAFVYFSYSGLSLYDLIAFPGCNTGLSIPKIIVFVNFSLDIIAVSTDLLIFGICMWKVWGTWRLTCNNGIRSTSSLISVLLKQNISRFCFVITITVANVLFTWFTNSSDKFFANAFNLMQNALSGILVADFTLDLRHVNSAKIEASQIFLPPLQFSNVLQHVHQSFLVEMATPEERNVEEDSAADYDHDHDNLPGSMEQHSSC